MAMKGFNRNIKPLEILNNEQIEAIHRGTLEILEETGIRVEHEKVLKLFADNNCHTDFKKQRVRIPAYIVEECLRKTPSSFTVKARDPRNNLRVGGNTLYFTPYPALRTLDLDTWEPRAATLSDQHNGVKILDALDNVHYLTGYTPYFDIKDVPPVMTIPTSVASRIKNTTKPIVGMYQKDSEVFCVEMAKTVGIDLLGGVLASPPLTYQKDTVEAAFRWTEAGFPIFVASGAVMGGTAPATLAGSTVTNNAEIMAGVVLVQLIKPGTGVVVDHFVHPMNMKTGQPIFGAIECALHQVMFNQIWRSWRIPVMNETCGGSSSKKIDFQCGYEKAMITFASALSGANLVGLHGCIYGELTYHPVQAVLDDDMAGMIGRFIEGVEVTDETLAIDLIKEVGPVPGHFLGKEHTRTWWKKEQFIPKVADRTSYPKWIEEGKKDALAKAKNRVKEIIATQSPAPLSGDQNKEIDKILEKARKYYEEKGLI